VEAFYLEIAYVGLIHAAVKKNSKMFNSEDLEFGQGSEELFG